MIDMDSMLKAASNAVAQELFDSHKPDRRPLTECAEDIAKAAIKAFCKGLPQPTLMASSSATTIRPEFYDDSKQLYKTLLEYGKDA